MLTERIVGKNDPEFIDGIFLNVDSIAVAGRHTVLDQMVDGDVVMFNITPTPTNPGREIKLSGAASVNVCGVVVGTINKGAYGRVRTYGYHPNVITDVATLAAGSTINGSTAVDAGRAIAGGAGDDPSFRLGFSVILGAGSRAACFIKCM